MTSSAIEALYAFDKNDDVILEHVYRSRPPSAKAMLTLYLEHPTPRPSLIYLPNINPPTVLFSLLHSDLLFLSPVSTEMEPLFVLEFLYRVIDILEDFIGTPLIATKIEGAYEVVAQLLGEVCDAGIVCNTEPNTLRDDVDTPGLLGKLFIGVGLPGSSPALQPFGGLKPPLNLSPSPSGPAIPWRRANVRHTSNELYVDMVETLSVTLAPSGRLLAAFANGSIAFTSKISGVPDLLLTLAASGGKLGMEKAIELPVFHPCVRVARWKEKPGELSFIPPDGKFVLASYEVNLLPVNSDFKKGADASLQLPVSIEVTKSLGPSGVDFEVRLLLSGFFPSTASTSRPSARSSGRSTPVFGSSSSGPALQDVLVTVPIPVAVRNITNLRSSRGEAYFNVAEHIVEWRIATKDVTAAGTLTLRCTVVAPSKDDETEDSCPGYQFQYSSEVHDEKERAYKNLAPEAKTLAGKERGELGGRGERRDQRRVQKNAPLMPSSASLSFTVKGWLASGIKVEGLVIDWRKSRGIGEGVKPYKGVKYLTVSRKGIETRC